MPILTAHQNQYAGIIIDADALPATTDEFHARLNESIKHWRGENLALVWLSLPSTRAELIPTTIAAGFEMHHCTSQQITLVLRLRPDATAPHYATHSLGAGAVILSPQQEVMTVLEKCDEHTRPWHYKLPGGMVEPGEHIAAAVRREVFEETSIDTRFEELLGFRHHHRGQFGTSNLYFVCRLSPLTMSITIDPAEIADARWIPAKDYIADETKGQLNRHVVAVAASNAGLASIELDNYMDGPASYEFFTIPDHPR